MAWLEIGFVDDVINSHQVSASNHTSWLTRVSEEKPRKIKRDKFAGSVQGSMNGFPWSFRGLIPLEV
jgi:hypothetical protein